MSKKKLIPFNWLPGSWGLNGKTREIAQAEYELEGTELLRKKIDININEHPEVEQKVAHLDLDKRQGKIHGDDYDKAKANILGEPWVTVKTLETNPDNPKYGRVELDWNDAFVADLEKHGYGPNPSDEDTVSDWYNELCRNIALEAYAGVGDFEEQVIEEGQDTPRKSNLHEDAFTRPLPVKVNKPETDDEKD